MRTRQAASAYAFIAFPLAVLAVFTLAPTVGGIALSLFTWNGSGPARFVGLSNFRDLAQDPRFWSALRNTVLFVALTVPPTVVAGFALASALHAPWFRGRAAVRTLVFMPTVISVVAIGVAWRWLLDDSGGLVPGLLRAAGWARPPALLQDGWWPFASLVCVQVWRGVGFSAVLYLAALSASNPSLLEAAAVDGASRWRVLRAVTWPLVRPTTAFLSVTGVIGGLQVFDVVFALTGDSPTSTTSVLNYTLFREFQQSRLGYASAVGVVILALTAGVTLVQFRRARRSAL